MKRSHYTFGDNSLAATRLKLLAATFEPSSRVLLAQVPQRPIRVAVDVGCGPGHSTRLLSQASGASLTVGFDQSPAFVHVATEHCAQTANAKFSFVCCNVLEGPLPLPSADLIFSRFLLTHLAEPRRALQNLIERLEAGGCLVLEEVEQMSGESPTLQRYYELVAALQANHNQSMTIGARLEEYVAALSGELTLRSSVSNCLVLTGSQMPQLHLMNIATWKNDPKVNTFTTFEELASLEAGLAEIVAAGAAKVTCQLRQIILEKR